MKYHGCSYPKHVSQSNLIEKLLSNLKMTSQSLQLEII